MTDISEGDSIAVSVSLNVAGGEMVSCKSSNPSKLRVSTGQGGLCSIYEARSFEVECRMGPFLTSSNGRTIVVKAVYDTDNMLDQPRSGLVTLQCQTQAELGRL